MALGHAAHLIGVPSKTYLYVRCPGGSIVEDPLGSKKPTLDVWTWPQKNNTAGGRLWWVRALSPGGGYMEI